MTDTPTFAEVLSRAIPADGTTIDQMRAALWDTPAGRTMINNGDVVLYWLNEADVTRAALAAAPQPAPVEREALVDVVAEELRATLGTTEATWLAEDVADALLARGLRLPGDETMAWAVLGEDGKMVAINYDRMTAQHLCNPGERIERVAIRVVEGGE